MLVVKCPQCSRSYRLAESLYRRKAAGYGVVITCRHCKTQIHVDEGSSPPGAPDGEAHETAEGDTQNPPEVTDAETSPESGGWASSDAVTNPPAAEPETNPAPAADGPAPVVNLKAADANEVAAAVAEIEAAVEKMGTPSAPSAEIPSGVENPVVPPVVAKDDAPSPVLPRVAPKPAALAPRPGGIPRPAGGPPRPSASATGTPLPGITSATATPTPGMATPLVVKKPYVATPASPGNQKAKLVALSPGLLGVGTALKPPSPRAVPAEEQTPESTAPLSVPDSALFESDPEPVSKPPDSTMPIDTVDYVESAPAAAQPPKLPPREPPKREAKPDLPVAEAKPEKRLPQAPPMRKAPPNAKSGERKEDELSSATGAPKMAEIALGSSPLQLSQKKGEPKRKPQPSGDLTDDLLSTDIGFDVPPALAPPDAAALTRAPVSSRRPGAKTESVKPGAKASTKAPVSTSTTGEKKGSGRGFVLFLLAATLGGGVYLFRHRLPPATPEPAPEGAVNAPAVQEPEPAPAPVAEAPAATVAEAVPSAALATPEPSAAAPEAAATAMPTATATSATAAVAPATTAAKPPSPRPEGPTAAAPTADKQVAAPTAKPTAAAPTSTAAIEPRGSVGTEPFDVAAARSALDASAGQASGCRKPGDPSGVAIVTITFSQTGRVTTANISGPPFQATPTGGCIASTMRKTRVPAFAGDMVTVRKTITVQ